jgi:gliding motility-associated-like protein
MPNAFSPNNDGLNDLYKPVLGCLPTTFDLSVYSKWGQLVFRTNDYKNYWNGIFNGKPLPVGVYVYILKTDNETLQRIQQLRGSIMLFR